MACLVRSRVEQVAAVLNTLWIAIFNAIYRKLGQQMTDWENHRTESEYENSLILKNSYAAHTLLRARVSPTLWTCIAVSSPAPLT